MLQDAGQVLSRLPPVEAMSTPGWGAKREGRVREGRRVMAPTPCRWKRRFQEMLLPGGMDPSLTAGPWRLAAAAGPLTDTLHTACR